MYLISGLSTGMELAGTHGPWTCFCVCVCLCALRTVRDTLFSPLLCERVDIKGEGEE